MRRIAALAFRSPCRVPGGGRGRLSQPSHHPDHALRAGRRQRLPDAHPGRRAAVQAQPDGAGAECRRRRRRGGLDAGGQGQARRLHPADQPSSACRPFRSLYKKLNFDPLASYEFIGLFAEAPMVILARKDFPPKDFAELVAYAKANSEKITVASAGMGSATHLCAMLFQEAIGVPLTIVQYKGAGPAVIDVRGGQVDLICDLPTTNSGLIRSGELKAYVLTAPQRMATLPDVPTAAEVGMPSLDYRRVVRPLRAARHAQAHPRHAEQGAARGRGRQGGRRPAREDRDLPAAARPGDARGASPEARRRRSSCGGRSSKRPASRRNRRWRARGSLASI